MNQASNVNATPAGRLGLFLVMPALAVAMVLGGCKKNQQVAEVPPPPPSETMPMVDGSAGGKEAPEPVVFDEVEPAPAPEPAAAPAASNTATQLPPEPAAIDTYVIRKGDTLWSIAKRFYGDGQRWVDIVNANPGIDPKKLIVGDEIILP